jgi:hypothetical protein
MSEKKFVVRFSTAGGEQLQATLVRLGESGEFAFDKIGVAADKTTAKLPILDAAVERQKQAFRDLENSLDPVIAATRRYDAAVEQATMAVKMGVATQEEANRVMALARARMDTMGGSITGGLAPGVRELRFHVQNAAYQIGDLAVQIGAGTAASVALGQQLPQLIGGFGMMGAVIGALVAVGVPALAYAFQSLREETKSLDDAIGELESSVAALQAANEAFTQNGLQEQIDKYGELNAEVALLISRQQELARNEAFDKSRQAIEALIAELDSTLMALEQLQNAQKALAEAEPMSPEAIFAQDFAANMTAAIEATGLTVEQVERLRDALDKAALSDTPDQIADAMAEVYAIIKDTTVGTTELEGQILAAESAMRILNKEGSAIGGWLGAAVGMAGSLADAFWNAAAGAAAAANAGQVANSQIPAQRVANAYGLYQRTRELAPDFPTTPEFTGPAPPVRPFELGVPDVAAVGSSGGGGGGSGMSDDMRDAQRIFEETRTEAERYAEELARVNELHDLGLLNTDTYNRALADLKEEYGEGNVAAQEYADGLSYIKGSLVDIATGAKSTREAFADMLDQMARDLLNSSIQTLLEQAFAPILGSTASSGGGLLGGLLGGLGGGLFGGPAQGSGNSILGLPSADGGGYTGSGARSGGLDGRGGFLAMLHPRETIIDHTKSSRGAGGATININLTGVSGDDAVRRAVQQGVTQGLAAYDRGLPSRVRQISGDPRAI